MTPADLLERDDLSVYVLAGVPRSFKKSLQRLVESESREEGGLVQVDPEFSEWMIARLRDEKRPRGQRTPAAKALWRAYSALSAARYYLQEQPQEEEQVRELRRRVEDLWREVSPMFTEGEEEEPASD